MEHRGEGMKECFASADHKEGVASFLERRPAVFTGNEAPLGRRESLGERWLL